MKSLPDIALDSDARTGADDGLMDAQLGSSTRQYLGPITVVEPQQGWVSLGLPELWHHRDLLIQLVSRDISAKYRQSILGIIWAIINPALQMMLYTIIFGKMARFPSDGVPYPIFIYAGLLPWLYFSSCLSRSSSSAVGGSALLTKVYFPRLILPLSKVVNGFIDVAIQFALLLVLMVWYGITPSWNVVFVPLFLVMCAVSGLSIGLWATAIAVKYRDVGQVISFIARMWMWFTPVLYPVSMVPDKWRLIYGLNPMTGVIEGFRWAILGLSAPDWNMMAISASVASALFIGGLYFFRRAESTFADII